MSTPAMLEEEVIFADAVEGLFAKGLGDRVTPSLCAKLGQAGLDLDAALLPAYPRAVWNSALALAAGHVWPDLDEAEAHRRLGRVLIDGFKETLLGRTLVTMARLLGPMRTLARMRHNLRTGGNYNETTHIAEQPGDVLFWINEPVIHPGYVRGMLEGTLEISGAQGVSVEVVARDAKGATHRVRWAA